MANKEITDSLLEAKDALDRANELGRIAYDICDGILLNIKAFIHDEDIWKEVNEHEMKLHKEFQKRIGEAREKLKTKDPLYAWNDGLQYFMELRHWKSLEMLNFMDKLSKEHDL